jgi:hypothetical protein
MSWILSLSFHNKEKFHTKKRNSPLFILLEINEPKTETSF